VLTSIENFPQQTFSNELRDQIEDCMNENMSISKESFVISDETNGI